MFNFKVKMFLYSVLFTLFTLYFGYFGIFGKNGVLKYKVLHSKLKEIRLNDIELSKEIINRRYAINGINNTSIDSDLLEEQIRLNLRYSSDKEIRIVN